MKTIRAIENNQSGLYYLNEERWGLHSRGLIVEEYKTNQFAEIKAIWHALKDTEHLSNFDLVIRSDSQYAIDSIKKWIHIWRQNYKKTKSGKNAKYFETIEQISDMMIGRSVEITKVKSHLNFVNN